MNGKLLLVVLVGLLLSLQASYSQMGFGIVAGLSTPNERINDIYNKEKVNINKEDMIGSLIREGVALGYHVGARVRLPMSDNLIFIGGITWNRFPFSDINVIDPEKKDTLLILRSIQNVIPISVGLNFYLFQSTVSVYAVGDISYNYIANSIDFRKSSVDWPLTATPADSRAGASFGAGIDINTGLVIVNLEGRYNFANLIGKVSEEKPKNYFTLSLGVYFGNSKPEKNN